jgi:HAD superfamily hydrolase (TIGR01490 family)
VNSDVHLSPIGLAQSMRIEGGTRVPSRSAGFASHEVEQALAIETHPYAAAFFDVDNTFVVGASIFHFAKGLAARKYFSTRDLRKFLWQQMRFRAGGEGHHIVADARESALAFIAGKSVAEIVSISEDIFDETIAAKIYSGTRALAQLHLDAGERVWLVTATPEELATIIARRLNLTGALGTRAEHRDGLFTGHLIGELLHGEAKAAAVKDLAEREGLDLAQCAAYSDSINDIPMLSLVGRPVAVNPDSALRVEARRRGWEIRDFRTGRKAARIGVPAALILGAAGAAAAGGVAIGRRRRVTQPDDRR